MTKTGLSATIKAPWLASTNLSPLKKKKLYAKMPVPPKINN
jgi:hypothetical protein